MSSFVSTQLLQSSIHLSLLMIFQINVSIAPLIRPQLALHNQKKQGSLFDQSNISVKRELMSTTYMQKMCDVAGKAILAKKKLRKKCVNRDKM